MRDRVPVGSQWSLSSLALFVLALVGSPGAHAASRLPVLSRVHHIASSDATFRTPDDWVVSVSGSNPEVVQAEGREIAVRFLRWDNELGLDSLHVMCLVERMAEP